MSIRPAVPATPATRKAAAPAMSPTSSRRAAPRTPRSAPTVGDPALDEALERISDLAGRLWAVRSAHRPVTTGWRRHARRCAECGQPVPCATLLAVG